MQFVVIAAVLVALAAAEHAPAVPVRGELVRLALVLCGMALVTLLARLAAGATATGLERDFDRRRELLRRFERWRYLHAGLWLAVVAAIVFGLDWAQMVRENWRLARTFLADEMLIIAPVLLPLVLSWAAFYEVDRTMNTQVARHLGLAPRATSRAAYVAYHARHYLALVLIPLMVVLALHDALDLAAPGFVETGLAWCLMTPLLAALVLVFPVILRHVWDTQPLPPGPLRRRLERVGQAMGVRVADILVWRSGGLICNAAVAGFFPSLRYVFLSDGLLARTSEQERVAVYAHELAHVRHRHLMLRAVALILPVVLWQAARQIAVRIYGDAAWAGLPALSNAGVGPEAVLMLLYVVTVFARYCRLLEFQADATACGIGGTAPAAPHASTVEDVAAALQTVAGIDGGGRKRGGLLHPAVVQRIDRLRRWAADPAAAARFQRRMTATSRAMVAACTAAGVIWLLARLA